MTQRLQVRFSRGLTLAEIAMALFIIGVGILSIVTVYLQRERTASITAQQVTAHRLAEAMSQRIAAQQDPTVRFENAIGVRCAKSPNSVVGVTKQALAVNDVACWQEIVAAEMPSGAGSIALDESTVPATYAITVSWQQPRGGLASYTVRAAAKTAAAGATTANAASGTANAAQKSSEVRAAN